jgi:hypothetical protein
LEVEMLMHMEDNSMDTASEARSCQSWKWGQARPS